MSKKPGWLSGVEAYKKELQERSLHAVHEKRDDEKRREAKAERVAVAAATRKRFGRRGLD